MLDANAAQLLIMVNQRILLPEVVKSLSKYISDGGTMLLVGSNGVFDDSSKKNSFAIRKLASQLTEEQVRYLYDWGLKRNIEIPLIIVSGNTLHFTKIPLLENPDDNYQILRNALSRKVVLAKRGKLALVSPTDSGPGDHMEKKDFVRDFDRNHNGVVSKREFPGPGKIFHQLDKNRDGIVTKELNHISPVLFPKRASNP